MKRLLNYFISYWLLFLRGFLVLQFQSLELQHQITVIVFVKLLYVSGVLEKQAVQ